MKITFLKDYQGSQSGNEFYVKGSQADLPKGAWLVGEDFARKGWGTVLIEDEPPPVSTIPVYSDWSYKALQIEAKRRGIAANQSKTNLIDALYSLLTVTREEGAT